MADTGAASDCCRWCRCCPGASSRKLRRISRRERSSASGSSPSPGWNLIPTAILSVLRRGVVESVEWWNAPIMGWTHAVLWVPHHVAGLVACFTGFLVIYYSFKRTDSTTVAYATASIAGGAMFASAVGLSVYVAFTFAVALAVLVVLLLLERYRAEAATLVFAGVVAMVVSLPYLMELAGRSGAGASGTGTAAAIGSSTPLFQFAVRPFTLAEQIVRAIRPDQTWLIPATNLLLCRCITFSSWDCFRWLAS